MSKLAGRGITVRCSPSGKERLWVKPKSALTPELRAKVKEHKIEIVRAMRDTPTDTLTDTPTDKKITVRLVEETPDGPYSTRHTVACALVEEKRLAAEFHVAKEEERDQV